jgi:peptidoglycan/xylan/chitin deacetylase (PgdA/CDA1 family)
VASGTKPLASLSLDLDNLWSYLKTHGETEWDQYPTYLDVLVPLVLDLLDEHDLKITFFIVGRDLENETNLPHLREIVARGHEIGNHSYDHEPWMQDYDEMRLYDEIKKTHDVLTAELGAAPVGFRGPGFCYSPALLNVLAQIGYQFDASTLPSVLGPIARLYYFASSSMTRGERETRKGLFGKFSDGFQPIKPFMWDTSSGPLLEIPVTTVPLFRTPFHLSYLLWLSRYSRLASRAYLELALRLCQVSGFGPSFLLHPLDVLGRDDAPQLHFFPGMDLPREYKTTFFDGVLHRMKDLFEVLPMSEHATRLDERASNMAPSLKRRPVA